MSDLQFFTGNCMVTSVSAESAGVMPYWQPPRFYLPSPVGLYCVVHVLLCITFTAVYRRTRRQNYTLWTSTWQKMSVLDKRSLSVSRRTAVYTHDTVLRTSSSSTRDDWWVDVSLYHGVGDRVATGQCAIVWIIINIIEYWYMIRRLPFLPGTR